MAFAADYAAPGGGAYECPTSSMGWPVLRRGRGTGRRHRAAGCALRQREPADYDRPQVSPGATAPLACRLRVGIPVKWTRAEGPQSHRVRRSCAIRRPARADHGCGHPPHAAHPHPRAGGRGDGPRAALERAAGIGLREARYATQPGQPEVIALRTCATGVQAARRHSGEVAARRRSWMAARRQSGTPSAAAPRHAMDAGAPRPARIPLRAPAVAAPDHGRLVPERAAVSCVWGARSPRSLRRARFDGANVWRPCGPASNWPGRRGG
jgi:hypothetical protein